MICVCDACKNDTPCRIDGGEGSGEPLYCPYIRHDNIHVIPNWREEV